MTDFFFGISARIWREVKNAGTVIGYLRSSVALKSLIDEASTSSPPLSGMLSSYVVSVIRFRAGLDDIEAAMKMMDELTKAGLKEEILVGLNRDIVKAVETKVERLAVFRTYRRKRFSGETASQTKNKQPS